MCWLDFHILSLSSITTFIWSFDVKIYLHWAFKACNNVVFFIRINALNSLYKHRSNLKSDVQDLQQQKRNNIKWRKLCSWIQSLYLILCDRSCTPRLWIDFAVLYFLPSSLRAFWEVSKVASQRWWTNTSQAVMLHSRSLMVRD